MCDAGNPEWCCECSNAVFGDGTEMCVCGVQLSEFKRGSALIDDDDATKSLCAFVLETQRPEDYEEYGGCPCFERGEPWTP